MNNQSGKAQGKLAASASAAESETARLLARARVMMIISVLTTGLAIAAVVAVIGYRIMAAREGGAAIISDGVVMMPPGAHVVSTSASGGRLVVTLDIGGASEVRVFDLKTLQQTGRLRFGTEH